MLALYSVPGKTAWRMSSIEKALEVIDLRIIIVIGT